MFIILITKFYNILNFCQELILFMLLNINSIFHHLTNFKSANFFSNNLSLLAGFFFMK